MMAQDRSKRNFLSFFSGKQFLIPLAALLALVIFNLIADPEFFRVTLGRNSAGDPVLAGNLISIL
ncbi:MAG: ABC transporter permease, partial [Ruminococcus sp.]|nr:ABC transporter permease [Ruminococcus sp.]